jgi:hypothetical protein
MAYKKIDKSGRLTFCHTNGYCKNHDVPPSSTSQLDLNKNFMHDDYKIFQELNESEYKTLAEEFYTKLTTEEASALMHYSDAGFKLINRSLMGLENIREPLVDLLDSSLSKARLEGKTLYRGARRDINKNVGDSHIFETFVSTSYNPQKAFEFTNPSSPILFILETKSGAPISIIHREMEVLLPRNKEFLVTDVSFSPVRLFYPETDEYSVSKKETKIYKLSEI